MSIETLAVTAEVKYTLMYTCSHCKRQESGDAVRVYIRAESFDRMHGMLKREEPRPANMPRGWASYPGNAYRCPRCITVGNPDKL